MNDTGIFIGADGGGTKIAYCLDVCGKLFNIRKEHSVNPNDVGYEKSAALVTEEMLELCSSNGVKPEDINGVFAGIAGASTADYKSILKAHLDKAFINSVNGVSHDGENILYAAFPDTDGVIVICGTGSSCFVKKGEGIRRIGGYSLFDLDGNGYEIGRRAVAHALKCVDGREKSGILCEKINKLCNGNCLDDLKRLLALPVKEIASFAPIVFQAAKEGDLYADAIIDSTAEYIAGCIDCASCDFPGTYNVCIAGSVGTDPLTIDKSKNKTNKNAVISTLSADPVTGAVYKAKKAARNKVT
jgi:N-acetylglucosamine kinase-like BadF-type ATPase